MSPHTPGPFTVEELSASAETERELGVTRIVYAPSRYEGEEPVAVAFVVFPDDAPLFAASADLLAAAKELVEWLDALDAANEAAEVLRRARLVIARAVV